MNTRTLRKAVAGTAVAIAAFVAGPAAHARGHWSVSLGINAYPFATVVDYGPRGYYPPGPVVYSAPSVYYAPGSVYYSPPPVYYAPPPVYFPGPVFYGGTRFYDHGGRGRWHDRGGRFEHGGKR